MNAETKILPQSDDALWSRVVHDVNAWRGACLQGFSAAEAGVTETLLSLSTVPEKGAAVCLRHLTGQRFDDTAPVLGTAWAFAVEAIGRWSCRARVCPCGLVSVVPTFLKKT